MLIPVIIFAQGITFEKIYSTMGVSYGWDVIEKRDVGYFIAGSITRNSTSVLLMNIDESGSLVDERYLRPGLIRSITHSDSNNYILAGIANNEDILILKIDVNGDSIWTKIIKQPFDGYAIKIISIADSGYVIAGHGHKIDWDFNLIKTNSFGDTLWTKLFRQNGTQVCYDAQEVEDKGYIIVGTAFRGDLTGSACIIRTDLIGEQIWSKCFTVNGNSRCYGIIKCDNGDFLLAGSTSIDNRATQKPYLLRINSQGDSLWTKIVNNNFVSSFSSIKKTSDGNFMATGNGGVVKADINGNIIWGKKISGVGLSIKETIDGGFIISGGTFDDYNILLVKIQDADFVDVERATDTSFEYELYQNFPNPFNSTTKIKFSIKTEGKTSIKIYNVLGEEVYNLNKGFLAPGEYEVDFNMSHFPAGIYFYRIMSGVYNETKKLILLR